MDDDEFEKFLEELRDYKLGNDIFPEDDEDEEDYGSWLDEE
jgi:hypothetical protein